MESMKMMKQMLMAALVAGGMLSSCVSQSYSVSRDAVNEMLSAPGMAVTPFQPAWLHVDGREIWKLKPEDHARVRSILQTGESRHVPELLYQTDDAHAPLVQNRFYLYASNAHCLAATVLDDRVAMHDLVLTEEQERELYSILKPYLKNVFKGLM